MSDANFTARANAKAAIIALAANITIQPTMPLNASKTSSSSNSVRATTIRNRGKACASSLPPETTLSP